MKKESTSNEPSVLNVKKLSDKLLEFTANNSQNQKEQESAQLELINRIPKKGFYYTIYGVNDDVKKKAFNTAIRKLDANRVSSTCEIGNYLRDIVLKCSIGIIRARAFYGLSFTHPSFDTYQSIIREGKDKEIIQKAKLLLNLN